MSSPRLSKEFRKKIPQNVGSSFSFNKLSSLLRDLGDPHLADFGEVRAIRNEAWAKLELATQRGPEDMHLGLCISPGARPMMAFGTSDLDDRDWNAPWLFLVERADAPFLKMATLFLLKYAMPITLEDIFRKPDVRGALPPRAQKRLQKRLAEFYSSAEFAADLGGTR